MKVATDAVAGLEYTLRDDAGAVLDSSDGGEPLEYLHGYGQIVPGLESALEGKSTGESFVVKVPAADGYGEWDREAVFRIPRAKLPPDQGFTR